MKGKDKRSTMLPIKAASNIEMITDKNKEKEIENKIKKLR